MGRNMTSRFEELVQLRKEYLESAGQFILDHPEIVQIVTDGKKQITNWRREGRDERAI